MSTAISEIQRFPKALLAHSPTPLELMPNLSKLLQETKLYIKRDDCTGLAMGGNKARQLEFYLGEALAQQADTLLITGAVQSNYVRMAAAAARKLGMQCHIQLEERVSNPSTQYHHSGNVLLDKLLGATIHSYPVGEDESGADNNLEQIADQLRQQGATPYVIHLSMDHPPLGALGYVAAAQETLQQLDDLKLIIDRFYIPTGSGATHAGFLFGLRLLGCTTPVQGICVRRNSSAQRKRIASHCQKLACMLTVGNPVNNIDIVCDDTVLAPGYGRMNPNVAEAMQLLAHQEGILTDPVYSGRTLAGLLANLRRSKEQGSYLFLHTGGQPALFGYESDLQALYSSRLSI